MTGGFEVEREEKMDPRNDSVDQLDREQFVRLLTRHDRVIRAFLRSLLPNFTDVDEVMQEVSVTIWRKFSSLDDSSNFCRWACGIARIEVLRFWRSKARDRIVLGEDVEQLIANEGVDQLAERQEQLTALEGCVEKLPEEKKRLVLEAYSGERSMKAIADAAGKSPESIYQVLSRLRRQLLKCIERSLAGVR